MKLKALLSEVQSSSILSKLLDKVNNGEYTRIGAGDNGIVWKINDEDFIIKKTSDQTEFELASVIVGRHSEFSCFVPVFYVNETKHVYIASFASQLPAGIKQEFNKIFNNWKQLQQSEGEISLFEFISNYSQENVDMEILNFIKSLELELDKTGLSDIKLEIDLHIDNIMYYNGNIVLTDW